jgi:hypothetical protein
MLNTKNAIQVSPREVIIISRILRDSKVFVAKKHAHANPNAYRAFLVSVMYKS